MQPKYPNMFERILDPLTGVDRLREERARLEAFLSAVPGEYCGFAPDGVAIYSDGFAAMLGLLQISTIHDIQGALETGDAAALEGFFYTLQEEDKAFSIVLQPLGPDDKIMRLRGSRGSALDGRDRFDILWLEDITDEVKAQQMLQRTLGAAEAEAARLQVVLDVLPVPLWMRAATGDLVWCNRAYGDLLDVSPSAAIGQQRELSLTAKGKNKASLRDMASLALKQGAPQTVRAHAIVGGKRRLLDIAEIPLPTTSRTLGMAQDMTRSEELEKELSRYHGANEQLLEQLRTAIAIFAPDHTLEFFNSAFSQLWGLEDQWLNKKPRLSDLLEKLRDNRRLPEQADFRKYKQGWLDMFTRLIDPREDMLHLPDGSALRMLVVPHPMGGLMMTFEDVTQPPGTGILLQHPDRRAEGNAR
jgi:PAS domain-containing protein